jgi:hypothetical protein
MSRRITLLLAASLLLPMMAAALPTDVLQALASSQYVYISSTRKDGALSRPAEIWFMWHDGAVYVGTRPSSWRVTRIQAGRPAAKIAVGKVDGPSFNATGSLVKDAKLEALLMDTYAKKYPDGWAAHAENFRNGFKDGSRVLVKYAPQ